jgi:curved DNA-binding protein CbpA
MTDHYATLGVPRTATADEIKKTYRKLASQHHPDKGGDTRKFQEIQAYP